MFDDVKNRLASPSPGMGAAVLDLQLTQVDRPPSYELAVDAKENARNNIDKIKNDKAQLITQANTNLLKVRIQANKTIASANTNAIMTKATAASDAAIVTGRYSAQAATYAKARLDQALSSEGLLAYMSIRTIDELNKITVGIEPPAPTSYGTNLTT